MMTRLLVFLFSLVFLVLGAAVTWYGWGELRKARESVNWPTAPGKVLSSEVVDAGEDNMQFDAAITYAYRVEGETRRNDQVALGQWATSDVKPVRRLVREFPEGASITVYYNPDDPAEAVLKTGPTFQSWMIPVMGVVFFFFGGFVGVASIFGRAQQD
jgi:hypothetical protein